MNGSASTPPSPEPPPRPKIRVRTSGGYLTDPSPVSPPATPPTASPASPTPATAPTASPATAPVTAPPGLPVRWENLTLPAVALAPAAATGIVVLLLALAAAGAPASAPVALWLGLVLGAASWRTASVALGWNLPVAVAHLLGVGLSAMALGAMFLVVVPAWGRDARAFEATVESVVRRVLPAEHQPDWTRPRAAHQRLTTTVAQKRDVLLAQSLFIMLVVAGWPAISRFVPPSPERPGNFLTALSARTQRAAGRWALSSQSRLAQATALTILAVAGTGGGGGLPAAWYVGGWVMALTCLWPPAGWWPCLAAAVLVAGAADVIRAAVALVATAAAMVVAGRWLHRQLVFRPAVIVGWIEPEIVTGPRHGPLWWTVRVVRIGIGLALVAILVWLGLDVVPEVRRDHARRAAIAAAESGQTVEPWLELLKQYPNDPAVLLGLVTAHCRRADYTAALPYAHQYATWQPAPTTEPTAPLKARVLRWLRVTPSLTNRAEGYEIILDNITMVEDHQDVVAAATDQTLAINPNSIPALLAAGNLAVARQQPDRALELAARGLQLAPDTHGWHAIRAGAFLQKNDWPNVIAAADAELALDPGNHHMATLRNTARWQLQRSRR